MAPSSRPRFLRSSISRIAITGAVTLATTFVTSPMAMADDDVASESQTAEATSPDPEPATADPVPTATGPEATQESEATGTASTDPEVESSMAEGARTGSAAAEQAGEAADVAYVAQRITISAKLGVGAYVTAGTTTVGTTFTISVTDQADVTCTTEESTLDGTESFCLFDDGDDGQTRSFQVPAGASVTVIQTGTADGLVIPEVSEISRPPVAEGEDNPVSPFAFDAFGPSPTTAVDERETPQGEPILIDVLDNDESIDPSTTLNLPRRGGQPAHGTVEIVSESNDVRSDATVRLAIAGGPKILYTPNEDYVGMDEFRYTLTNGNGSTSGTVTVNVLADEAVEPDFGYQKFRVGVKIADGSYVPSGASTLGSTFHIVFSDDEGVVEEVDCTSEVPEVDPDSDVEEDPTSTFCVPDEAETPPFLGRAAAAEVGDDDDYRPEQYYEMQPGETATITQTKAGPGLERSRDVVTIAPCEAGSPDFPSIPQLQENCASGDIEATPFKTTKVLFVNEGIPKATPKPPTGVSGVSGVSDNNATEVDGVLPDTGGSNAGLLGYAALMLVGGGWLTARGRRRSSADALVD